MQPGGDSRSHERTVTAEVAPDHDMGRARLWPLLHHQGGLADLERHLLVAGEDVQRGYRLTPQQYMILQVLLSIFLPRVLHRDSS